MYILKVVNSIHKNFVWPLDHEIKRVWNGLNIFSLNLFYYLKKEKTVDKLQKQILLRGVNDIAEIDRMTVVSVTAWSPTLLVSLTLQSQLPWCHWHYRVELTIISAKSKPYLKKNLLQMKEESKWVRFMGKLFLKNLVGRSLLEP